MPTRPFREHHLLQLLERYEQQQLPLDLFISNYFRMHKALGAKDRAFIAETIYGMMRWKGLLDELCKEAPGWEKRLSVFLSPDFKKSKEDQALPLHTRLSFPQNLFDKIVHSHGEAKAIDLCTICNQPAPTTIRINSLKTTRDALLTRWKAHYEISPCYHSKVGIIFHKRINFFVLPEFKEGLFEVQDEGSQLLSELIQPKPGDQVLDFCSGSGGKTLAFAPQMQGKGQIFLHDVRPYILQEAKKRLRRAGIQNAQIVLTDDPKLKKLKKQMDWILVDVPCSGTGTLRRNPDMKWKYSEETLQRLVSQQRVIFEKALSFLKPEGRIVYATCSILNEENLDQLNHFIKTYNLQIEGKPFQSLPSSGGMDGFFGVVLKRALPNA